jgi:DNA-binding NarL/FixJ family response regulator
MSDGIAGRTFLIIDESDISRCSVRSVLSANGAGEIQEASDFATATKLCEHCAPDVIITDTVCSGESYVDLISSSQARAASITTIVFTDSDDPDDAIAAVRAGAAAFVLKSTGADELAPVFRKIEAGDHYIDHAIALRMIFRNEQANAPTTELSRKELEILRMLGEDKTMAEIADLMNLAYKTVIASCSRLKAKLRIGDTEELSRFARQRLLPNEHGGSPP